MCELRGVRLDRLGVPAQPVKPHVWHSEKGDLWGCNHSEDTFLAVGWLRIALMSLLRHVVFSESAIRGVRGKLQPVHTHPARANVEKESGVSRVKKSGG